jgi:hypothetical protein
MSQSDQPPQQPQHPPFQPAAEQPGPGVPPRPGQPGPDEYPTQPVPVGQPVMGEVPTYDRGTPGAGRRNLVLAAVIALAVGLGAGYAVGRQTAPKGATSLAQAIQLAGQGKLPTGNLAAARGNGGLGGLFRRGQGAQGGQGGQGAQGAQGAQGGQGQNGQAAPGAGNGNRGNGNGGGFLFGGGQRNGIQATVSSVSGDTITVETAAGQLRVRIGSTTKIQKAAAGAKSDITPGSRVLLNFDLNGSQNDDGSVAAASILSEGKAS